MKCMAIYLQKVQSMAALPVCNCMIIMSNYLWHGICS